MQTKRVEVVPYDDTWVSAFEEIKNETFPQYVQTIEREPKTSKSKN